LDPPQTGSNLIDAPHFRLILVPFIEADKTRLTQIYSARLSDPESIIRGFAAQGLEELGSSAKSAVPALVDSLSKAKKDDLSRSDLIDALGAIGKAARKATPLLVELSSDENGYVAQHALDALLKVDVELCGQYREAGRSQTSKVDVSGCGSIIIEPSGA
jgi:HEAT repeats